MAKTITLTCKKCANPFDKPLKEYTRRTKLGHTSFFCTTSCQVSHSNSTRTDLGFGNVANLRPGRTADDLSPFRWFVGRAMYRRKKKGATNLTAEYLHSVWERQSGHCPFTGWELILPRTTMGWSTNSPQNASLDRIDNSVGYVCGNVRFVARMANVARGINDDVDLIQFCIAVANNHEKKVLDAAGVEPAS